MAIAAVCSVVGFGYTAIPATADAVSAPSPVRNLVATASGDTATVTWQAPVSGTVARYVVEAHRNDYYHQAYPDFGTRIVSGSATSITWDGLPLNQRMHFTVTPIGPDGAGSVSGPAGPFNATTDVTPTNSYCPVVQAGDCVVVNTANSLGTETRPGAGLLHGTVPIGNKWVRALNLNFWRIQANNATQYSQAAAVVPSQNVIELLSDAWYGATRSATGYAADPWANWSSYTSFVTTVVRQAQARGQDPIWEIQNEPEGYPYDPAQPPSRALVEAQYLKAYQAIKSVNPQARVVGPSIDWQYESSSAPWYIDMKSFIPFAAANGMKLYAIAWHDNSDLSDQSPLIYSEMPQVVRDHAEEVRELVAENPGIGSPLLFGDENSSPSGTFIPGFAAGYFAAEDQAGLDEANRACWSYPESYDPGSCFGPNLDGLLNRDGNPNASYWTMVDYGAMSGARVQSETSDINLSALAVTNSGVTRVLLGRHQTCSEPTTTWAYCHGPATLPAPVATTVQVLLPTGVTSATVQVQAVPNTRADLTTAPATTTSTVAVVGGLASITIPSFGDGDAYFVTIATKTQPGSNATAGPPAPSGDLAVVESPQAIGPAVATRMLPVGGNEQSAPTLGVFAQPFVVLATDQYGNPVANVPVTFSLYSAHSATFSDGSITAIATTDSLGLATSPAITAGAPGSWVATARAAVAVMFQPVAYFGMANTA